MKQLIQSFKTGELGLFEVPAPVCEKNGALVQTTVSLVSAGTEKMLVDFAKKYFVNNFDKFIFVILLPNNQSK